MKSTQSTDSHPTSCLPPPTPPHTFTPIYKCLTQIYNKITHISHSFFHKFLSVPDVHGSMSLLFLCKTP
ncbi:hypothetical protein L2E82_14817 [Cichorium intybus]|uniref:Uncharacterized protein n=1 Tax=Cichorium intybus TaxID=13427 RepID=A0ACB9F279_CICIN|nr:hypothetical protein L2E82_14817 [Cichorium intybus]